MKINKSTWLYFLIGCIIFILYFITVLILVSTKNEVFWVSYVFSLVTLMVSTGAIALSNSKIETLFIPIVIISVLYFSAQIIVGIIVFFIRFIIESNIFDSTAYSFDICDNNSLKYFFQSTDRKSSRFKYKK